MTDDSDKDNMETNPEPLKVEVTNQPKEIVKDNTSWDTQDEWDIINMTEEDIKEAEEARNA